jgi:hypothetical protein
LANTLTFYRTYTRIRTQAKEADVKKALKKYEGVLKVKGAWARKESKRGESMVSVRVPRHPLQSDATSALAPVIAHCG